MPAGLTVDITPDDQGFGRRLPPPAAGPLASMALRTEPVLDESLVSWVDRTAAAFGVTAGEALRGFGLLGVGSQRVRLYGITLSVADLDRLAAVAGLGTERIGDMLLERFDRSALDLTGLRHGAAPGQVAVQQGAMFWGTRACPGCLRESGGAWNVRWKLRLAAACSTHRVILVDSCPACGALPRQGRSGSGWPETLSAVPCPTICGHCVAGATCSFDLAAMAPAGADDSTSWVPSTDADQFWSTIM